MENERPEDTLDYLGRQPGVEAQDNLGRGSSPGHPRPVLSFHFPTMLLGRSYGVHLEGTQECCPRNAQDNTLRTR